MQIVLPKKIPQHIAARALTVLAEVEAGTIRPKKAWCTRSKVRVAHIGRAYRAIEFNGKWHVLSHEDYNNRLREWSK